MSCSIESWRRIYGASMVWVIIGCTILIIVCLGGGKRLGQIVLGAVAIVGAAVLLGNAPEGSTNQQAGIWAILFIGGFFALMIISKRMVAKKPDEPR
jgi:ABC-type branched-subunit amino acid transport system permease subunit